MSVRDLTRECVEQVHGELSRELDRPPTMTELEEITGLSGMTLRKACEELSLPRTLEKRGRKAGAPPA